jgi:hypothetical protein
MYAIVALVNFDIVCLYERRELESLKGTRVALRYPKWLYSMLSNRRSHLIAGYSIPHYYFSNDNGNVQA